MRSATLSFLISVISGDSSSFSERDLSHGFMDKGCPAEANEAEQGRTSIYVHLIVHYKPFVNVAGSLFSQEISYTALKRG